MKYLLVLAVIFLFYSNDCSIAAESRMYCDYYDDMGDFLLTFDAKIHLGPSGKSRTSGIKFLFSDSDTLSIYTVPSTYNIGETYNNEPVDIYEFTEKYLNEGCSEVVERNFKEINCSASKYSLILTEYKSSLFCTYIIYNATSSTHNKKYKRIINSMLFFKQNDLINNNARAIVAFAGWPNYNEHYPYEQPRLFCGKYQIRSDLELIHK
jgi:hypothetical protein